MSREAPRLLILVVAYHAEETLGWVLDRVPRSVLREYETEVLVVDDASADQTFDVGNDYRVANPELPLTVLRNRVNQGYGGNQKVGYAYALQRGFDFVAMLHGDGQYAPEELPNLLRPLREGNADAVFGSRMATRWGALKGGMPPYKFVGNRILTACQNALLGSALTEFHSGYRLYSVEALRRIPFRLNSNDFHFDTEIIIQLLNAQLRIVEVPIPTYYGNEICRVQGLKYAGNVLVATLRNWFHRRGLLYQRRFDVGRAGAEGGSGKLGFPSGQEWARQLIPPGSRVVAFGRGSKELAEALAGAGSSVVLVCEEEQENASNGVRKVLQTNGDPSSVDVTSSTHVVLFDIVEHVEDPERFLEKLRQQCDYEAKKFIVVAPNVAFVVQRLMLLAGQFNYSRTGILDFAHRRLFTFRGLRHLLRDEGFLVIEERGVPAPFPKAIGEGKAARILLWVNQALIRISRTLFSYEILIVAESTPPLSRVFDDALLSSAFGVQRGEDDEEPGRRLQES
jgi:glycosyltransferase involved in cell wall biosynthesis